MQSIERHGLYDPVFEPGIEKGETHVSPSRWDTCLTKLKKVRHMSHQAETRLTKLKHMSHQAEKVRDMSHQAEKGDQALVSNVERTLK